MSEFLPTMGRITSSFTTHLLGGLHDSSKAQQQNQVPRHFFRRPASFWILRDQPTTKGFKNDTCINSQNKKNKATMK
jgi:hypothetical protein